MKAQDIFSVTGKTALITGAATGLGARFAQTLADNGANIVIVGRNLDKLEQVAKPILETGGNIICALADVNDQKAMHKAFDLAEEKFGLVNILINNAGIATPKKAIAIDESEYRQIMATNLDSVWFNAQECAKRLLAAKEGGNIINIASILGTGVQKGVSTYAITKAAVIQLTKALSVEWASKNIRVNAIAPGYIYTNINSEYLASPLGQEMRKFIPTGDFGQPEDLDGALLLLASNAARFMSGALITVDGGHVSVLGS